MRPRSAGAAIAALAFLVWHGVAILLAPYPESDIRNRLYPFFEPYLRLAYLDHRWNFFAPRPDGGRIVRYRVVHVDGTTEELPLTEALHRASPTYFRWYRLFDLVATYESELTESGVGSLCRRHVDLLPRGIELVVLHQLAMSPELYLAGVRPREAVRWEVRPEMPCPPGHDGDAGR